MPTISMRPFFRRQKKPCEGFCCSAFRRYEQPPAAIPAADDLLSNEPHPIFGPFASQLEQRFLRPDLRRPLQLVSRLFEMDTFGRFVVSLREGDVWVKRAGTDVMERVAALEEVGRGECLVVLPKREHRFVDERMRSVARETMKALVGMIDFDLQPKEDDSAIGGMTSIAFGPLSKEATAVFHHGCGSLVALFQRVLDAPSDWHFLQTPAHEHLDWEFRMAQTLLHELGHVLVNAMFGRISPWDPYYNNHNMAEAGYEITNEVMGGSTEFYKFDFSKLPHEKRRRDHVRFLRLWPSNITGLYYHMNFNSCPPPRVGVHPYDAITQIDDNDVLRLFSDSFWQSMSDKDRAKPLLALNLPRWIVAASQNEQDDQRLCSLHEKDMPEGFRAELEVIVARSVRRRGGMMEDVDILGTTSCALWDREKETTRWKRLKETLRGVVSR